MTKTKAPDITEKQFQSWVVHLAKILGWRIFHPFLSIHSERGWPDLSMLNVKQRRAVFAELKGEKGKLTDKQTEWLEDMRACQLEAYLWRPGMEHEIEQCLKGVSR